MANLLDQASIVLTPTAYDNGKVLCAKPSEAPYGDFDFSRNSAATRVNAQGLVENVQILSSNLVQNGDFSEEGVQEVSNGSFSQEGAEEITNGDFTNGTTGWSSNATLTESNNIANITTTSPSVVYIRQNNVYEFGKRYKLTFTAKVDNLTEFQLYVGSTNAYISTGIIPTQTTDFQEYNFYFQADTAGGMNLLLRQSMVANSSIEYSEISVREVGQDWTLLNAELTDNAVIIGQADGSISQFGQLGITTIGKQYKLSYDVLEDNGGAFNLASPSTALVTTLGSHTVYFEANSADLFIKRASSSTTTKTTFTNISVKEVGMDWTLGTGVSIGSNEAVFTSTPSGQSVGQNAVAAALPNGALAKVSFEVLTRTEGTFGIYFSGTLVGTLASAGVFTGYFTKGTETSFYIRALGTTSGTISNVNVIQITDDTNLPRISYENFSYQDVLGSELVVNGDFATDSNWVKQTGWSISSGTANCDGANGSLFQNGVVEIGKSYLCEFEIKSITSGSVAINAGGNTTGVSRTSVGIYSEILQVSSGSNNRAYIISQGFNGSIDNVSVKEYLGQEVVPNSGCGSWLFEPQSTNLITYSSDYTQWNKSGSMVITSNNAISPDGTQNASLLTANAANQFIYLTGFSSTNSTISLYIKRKTGTGSIELSNNGGASYTVLSVTDEWSRVQVTFATSTNQTVIKINTSGDEIYLWGVQLEALSYASSLIPTEGSTVTRNKDVCKNGGSLATINSTEGTLYAEIAALANDGGNRIISLSNGSQAQRVIILFTSTNNQVRAISANNSNQCDISFIAPNVLDYLKVAFKYKQNDFALWVNGIEVGTDTNGITSIGLNELAFDNASGGANFYGKTKAVAFWKEALSDQELADLTYPTPTDPTFTLDFDTIAEQFTFARGSEATYVDAQGLIQSTNEIGEELVVNGDFEDGSTGWLNSNINGFSISNGKLNLLDVAYAKSNFQPNVTTVGKTYKVTFEVSNYVKGQVRFFLGGSVTPAQSSNGVFTFYVTASANTAIGVQTFDGGGTTLSIDNISVKEYTTATNTPRLDYSTGAEAFLLEPQSTNLIPYSEDFSQWTKSNTDLINTITSTIISPDGVDYANKLYPIGSNTGSYIRQAAAANCFSIFIKKGERRWVLIYGGFANSNVWFNSENGLLGTVKSEATATVENFGNDWYRLKIFWTQNSTQVRIYSTDADNTTQSTGNGTDGVYIWGAQLEEGYATSYIPSNGSQTTRNQETCINATPEINSEQGVLYAEISALADGVGTRTMSLSDGTANNSITIRYTTSVGVIQAFVVSGGSFQFNANISGVSVLDFNKVAIKYSLNDMALWINGVEVATDTSGSMPLGLSEINFTRGDGANKFFGNTKDLQYYPKALSDAELIKLTT